MIIEYRRGFPVWSRWSVPWLVRFRSAALKQTAVWTALFECESGFAFPFPSPCPSALFGRALGLGNFGSLALGAEFGSLALGALERMSGNTHRLRSKRETEMSLPAWAHVLLRPLNRSLSHLQAQPFHYVGHRFGLLHWSIFQCIRPLRRQGEGRFASILRFGCHDAVARPSSSSKDWCFGGNRGRRGCGGHALLLSACRLSAWSTQSMLSSLSIFGLDFEGCTASRNRALHALDLKHLEGDKSIDHVVACFDAERRSCQALEEVLESPRGTSQHERRQQVLSKISAPSDLDASFHKFVDSTVENEKHRKRKRKYTSISPRVMISQAS